MKKSSIFTIAIGVLAIASKTLEVLKHENSWERRDNYGITVDFYWEDRNTYHSLMLAHAGGEIQCGKSWFVNRFRLLWHNVIITREKSKTDMHFVNRSALS